MASVVLRVGKGMPPKPRRGKSWRTIAARGLGARTSCGSGSYVWLLVSRLLFLVGGSLLVNFVVIYLARALRHVEGRGEPSMYRRHPGSSSCARTWWRSCRPRGCPTAIGRKPLIFAACAGGAAGSGDHRADPVHPDRVRRRGLFGAANGSFLAVDWALMTDIIPRASAGRYMGMSNVATASAGAARHRHRRDRAGSRRSSAGARARLEPAGRVPPGRRSGSSSARGCCVRSTNVGAMTTLAAGRGAGGRVGLA